MYACPNARVGSSLHWASLLGAEKLLGNKKH
jgi:hypothetical protein